MGSMLPSSRGSAVIRGRVGPYILVSWVSVVSQWAYSACRCISMVGRFASSYSTVTARRLLYRHLMHRL
jgi:hypothetical protein